MGKIIYTAFTSWDESVPRLLQSTNLLELISQHHTILIKPNLVENIPPPVTTPVELVEAVIDYLQEHAPEKKLIIAEGIGAKEYDTLHCFNELGYSHLASIKGVELIDLNEEPSLLKKNSSCERWPEMYLPELTDNVFLFSVPVLKVHTLAKVTLTMKNMMGLPPPKHYQDGGYWKKSSFHQDVQNAIFDLNRYRTPDFTLLDATIGMIESHLWGATCNPPKNIIAASSDPVAIDAYGASLLEKDWRNIDHIRLAHKKLGVAEPLEIQEI